MTIEAERKRGKEGREKFGFFDNPTDALSGATGQSQGVTVRQKGGMLKKGGDMFFHSKGGILIWGEAYSM